MYTFDSRVRYSEVGEDARITVNAIIDYMQDCTNFQSEDLGVGLEYHKKKQLMWVLNSWQIVIEKYPAMGEEITVGTQAYGFEKMKKWSIKHRIYRKICTKSCVCKCT